MLRSFTLPSHGFRAIATQSRLPRVDHVHLSRSSSLQVLSLGKVRICLNKKVAPIFDWFPYAYIIIYYTYIYHLLDQVQSLSEPCREGRRAATQSFASAEGHWDPVGPKSANSPFRWPRSSGQGYHQPKKVESLSTMDHCDGKMVLFCWQPCFWGYELIKTAWILGSKHIPFPELVFQAKTTPCPVARPSAVCALRQKVYPCVPWISVDYLSESPNSPGISHVFGQPPGSKNPSFSEAQDLLKSTYCLRIHEIHGQ